MVDKSLRSHNNTFGLISRYFASEPGWFVSQYRPHTLNSLLSSLVRYLKAHEGDIG